MVTSTMRQRSDSCSKDDLVNPPSGYPTCVGVSHMGMAYTLL